MKAKGYAWLLACLALIGLLGYVIIMGMPLGKDAAGQPRALLPAIKAMTYGLDLRGGVTITYEPEAGVNPTLEQLETVKSIMLNRLSDKNYFDVNVTASKSKRIIVEIPDITDPQKAVAKLGQTALLQYIIPNSPEALADGFLTSDEGEVILSGTEITGAQAYSSPTTNQWEISFSITKEAQKKFADATAKLAPVKGTIAIALDGKVISNPTVSSRIDSESAQITGNFDEKGAKELANLIKSGALPFKLKVVSTEYVGASLGENALNISIRAGIIGMLIIMLFMIIVYRVPGLAAALALSAYVLTVVFILARTEITLTLPGIAGIILSMGIAVDANVIIFERLKEELKSGKTIKAAIATAFDRGWPAIRDSNITTIITSLSLIVIGTGPIKGFAWVLIIGIIVSMISAILLTRFILAQFYNIGFTKKTFYGAKGEKA